MKKYTIYASGVHGTEAFNMTYARFANFTVVRGYGMTEPGKDNLEKFSIITVFGGEDERAGVTALRDKFTAMSGVPARATEENITIL